MEKVLIQGALLPVKPDHFMQAVEQWYQSSKCHFQAKQFIENSLDISKIKDDKCMLEEYEWTIERAQNLGKELKSKEIYADEKLKEQTLSKIKKIEQLSTQTKEYCESVSDEDKLKLLK